MLGGMGFVYYLRIEAITVDTRLLGFLTAVLVLTTFAAGALPALIAGRVEAARVLGEVGQRETGRGGRLRATVTVVQLALSVCLLVGAALLVRTVQNLYATDPGFEVDGVTAVVTSSARKLELDQIEPFQRRVLEALRSIPGVESAALDVYGPFGPGGFRARVRTPGTLEANAIQVTTIPVSPGWFETLRLPILRGRSFTEADWSEAGAHYVVLSENVARRIYGDADPIGRSLMLQTGESEESVMVVGVARAAHLQSVDRAPTEIVYRSFATAQIYGVTGLLRAPGVEAAFLAEQVREAMRRAAPDLPAPYIDTLSKRLDNRLAEQRLFARLLSLLSSIAVLLAAVGLYGVIAYTVAARTRELGIRMALGARTTRIVRQVLGQAAWLVGIGVALGLSGALVLARILEARLFGVSPMDPVTYLSATLLFALVSLAACLAPLRAATRVDPIVALRSDH
jgi:predicted permease